MGKKLTRDDFLKRIDSVSGGSISVVDKEYCGTQETYTFKCNNCGYEWKTRGYSVLQGHGCRKCYDRRNSENKMFSLEEVQKRVDESGSQTEIIDEYIDTKHKCVGKCKICGNIWRPNVSEIMRGHGCPKCGIKKQGLKRRITTEGYEDKCVELYGDLYDLSELNYTTTRNNVYPICKKHGKVSVNALTFMRGHGCPKCTQEKNAMKQVIRVNDFIEKANDIHNGYYRYDNIKEIKNTREKLEIICPKHGVFLQTIHTHLRGRGCKLCGFERTADSIRYTTDDFIDKAVEIHNGYYDYSMVDVNGMNSYVDIICPKHGVFKQRPTNHLRGCGCQKCNSSRLEVEIRNLLIDNNIRFKEQYKSQWLGLQSLDFYLPDYKVGIECQGIQHFNESTFFGGKDGLNYSKERDDRKLKKCQDNGVKLLYYSNLHIDYPYEVFEDKEKLLNEIKSSIY